MSERHRAALHAGALLLLCGLPVALLYLPALGYPFVDLDDYYGVVTNPGIRDLSWDGLRFLLFEDRRDFRWFPLAWASFAIDHARAGLEPRAFHATNLALHLANTALVFALVGLVVRDRVAAAVAALLFGIHPLQVEAVAWVSSRKTLLFMTFFLLSALAYWPHGRSRAAGTGARPGWLAASVGLFALSLGSKTTAVTLPAVLLLLDHHLAAPPKPGPVALLRRHGAEKLWYLPPIALAWVMTARLARRSPFLSEWDFGWFERGVIVAHNFFFYVAKALVPTRLGVFYPLPDDGAVLPIHFFVYALLGVALAAACVACWRRRPLVFLGLGWYGVTIAPSAVLPFAFSDMPLLAADRYFYQSAVGLFLLAGVAAALPWRRSGGSRLRQAGWIVVLGAVLGVPWGISSAQLRVWRGTVPLYEHTLRHHPSDALFYRLALEYDFHGREAAAFGALEQAESAPHQVFFARLFGYQLRIADLYRRKGDAGRAAEFLERAIDAAPNAIEPGPTATPVSLRYLAELQERAGRSADAARTRERAAAIRPTGAGHFERFWFEVAPDEARRFLERRVAEAPDDAAAWYHLGQWHRRYGEPDLAREPLRRAARLGLAPEARP